jgi:hypothetical protein
LIVRLIGAVVAAVMVAGFAIGFVNQRGDRSASSRRASVTAYDRAIQQPARDGGFVIQEGLKHGLAEVAADQPGAVAFQAVSWVATLEKVRSEFTAAARHLADDELRAAAADFDTALLLYKQAAETIGAAAIASGAPRTTLLERAARIGRDADRRYDAASAHLQKARRSVGLPPSDRFPGASDK